MQTSVLSEEPGLKAAQIARESHARLGIIRRFAEQEWAPAFLFFFCDVICWFGLYGGLGYLRHDALFSSGFEFAVIDVIQLAVIVQALFVIGGYSSRVEMRGLTYTAEHIIAMLSALAVSALILYAAATYDHAMHPSRSVV